MKSLQRLEKRPCNGQLPKEQSQQVGESEGQRERVEDMPELRQLSGPRTSLTQHHLLLSTAYLSCLHH